MFQYLYNKIFKTDDLIKIKESKIRQEALKDPNKALKALVSSPDIFSSDDILKIARSSRGAAIYINFNDRLREKIDQNLWLEVMAQYSWDSARQCHALTQSFKNKIRNGEQSVTCS